MSTALTGAAGEWFVPLVPDPDRSVALFGLPQAGAGCSAFADCATRLDPNIAMWGLNLPGRQARFNESPVNHLGTVIEAIVRALEGEADRPYVLFGYCSGAALAYLTASAVIDAGLPAPSALVVASYPAPHRVRVGTNLPALPADEFWEKIIANGGIPASLTGQPDYREVFEPALRADYALLTGFEVADRPVLDVPLLAFAGRRDPLVSRMDMVGWADYTTRTFRLELLDAAHWLLDGVPHEVDRILEDACLRPVT